MTKNISDIKKLLFVLLLGIISLPMSYAQEPDRIISEDNIDAFIKVIASKKLVHMSDTVSVSYVLYVNHYPNRISKASFPNILGFYATAVRSSQEQKTETIDGVLYHVIELRKLILQARVEGKHEMQEGLIELEYDIPTGKVTRDFWGNVRPLVERVRKEVKIDSVTIRAHDMISV